MRPIELPMALLALLGSVLLAAGFHTLPLAVAGCMVLLSALTAWHLLSEGAHWQLVPLYVAECGLLACGFVIVRSLHPPSFALRLCGGFFLLLIIASALLSWLIPMFRLPKPTGAYGVGTRILHVVDPKRDAEGGRRPGSQRELMVQVWYPTDTVSGSHEAYRRRAETTFKSSYQSVLKTHSLRDAPVSAAGAPHPVLLFNPAWTGQRTQSTFLMQELASHGFVVASIDHTYYSGMVAFPDGRVFDGHMAPALGNFTHLSIAEGIELADQFVEILAEDVISVLDRLAVLNEERRSPWHGLLDMARVGALGHSVGGAAAAEAALLDPRIRAAVNLDGWTFGQVLREGLAKPWMLVYGKGIEIQPADLSTLPESAQRYWQMNRENYAAVEAGLRRLGGYEVTIEGASHWNFSDRSLYSPLRSQTDGGSIRPARAHQIIADVTRAFFAEALTGDRAGLVAETVRIYKEATLVIPGSAADKK